MNRLRLMQRLGKNLGAYRGETIDIDVVLSDIAAAALSSGWQFEPIEVPQLPALHTWCRMCLAPRARVYLSAGIHGDEPAGPLAIRQLFRDACWPDDCDVWICPCLNPTGFPLNRRENALGFDLNRQYLQLEAPETRAHAAWLQRQPAFDVALCLHEDWESHGFYLYELNPDNRLSVAASVIEAVERVCPIDRSPLIEGRPARDGIIRPDTDPRSRPQWPEAFYLLTHKTRHSYTMEAPSDFSLETRVAALICAVRTVMAGLE